MNIKHKQIFDKLEVFELAGDSTRGYDYAIPQPWADELQRMGIENVSQWFVADCSGPSALPRLRHVGEAVYAILNARNKANEEIVHARCNEEFEERQKNGPHNNLVMDICRGFAGNQVFNEVDAGFVDMNMVIGLITEAYARGRKSAIQDNTKEDRTSEEYARSALVNEKPKYIFESSEGGGDGVTALFTIVMRKWKENEWVVHFYNHQDGGFHYGVYRNTEADAMMAYITKCHEYAVNPFPQGFCPQGY